MNPPASTRFLNASGVVKAAPGQLVGVILAAGSAAATVTLYDDPATTSGDILAILKCAANTSVVWSPSSPQLASHGLYAFLVGTGAYAMIIYY
ncbi:MAG: hypothetical protein ACUVWZ_13845 [Anaerolineae bacterium]